MSSEVEAEVVRTRSLLTSAEIFKRDYETRYQEKTREARRVFTERSAMRRRYQGIDEELAALRGRMQGLTTEGSEFIKRLNERAKLGGMTATEKKDQTRRRRVEKVESKVERIKRQMADLQRELQEAQAGAA